MTRRHLRLLLSLAVSVFCLTPGEIEAERSGWNANPNTQYHIQTDEGPERFFRYQTLNGQYRKEKRLADGTVIGTEGWLDPLGYLRLKDYIADEQGFRILKSKMIYVGKDRPIQDALLESKKIPPQGGILAKPRRPPNPFRKPERKNISPLSGNELGSGYLTPSTIRPTIQDTYVPSAVNNNYYPTTPRPTFAPVVSLQNLDTYVPRENSYYPSRPLAILQAPLDPYDASSSSSSESLPLPLRVLESPPSNYDSLSSKRKSARPADVLETPYHTSLNSPASYSSLKAISSPASRADTSTQDFPQYDGIHETNNGFQYYLKRQYHEEEREPSDGSSVGSFGYIDPFGIRRVVYYKTDPYSGGFVHKKNNKYVGFAATPYDPLPPDLSARTNT